MRRLTYLFLTLMVGVLIYSCAKEEDTTKIQGEVQIENRDASVWICHKPEGNNPHAIYVDESAVDAHLGHGDALLDVDGDGYTAANACGEEGLGFDCDDNDAAVNSGATEVPYDGIDNDCDPATLDDDLDEDGYTLEFDCDDTEATTNPGAEELCDDNVDNNCDGQVDEDCGYSCGENVDCNFCDDIELMTLTSAGRWDKSGLNGEGCLSEAKWTFICFDWCNTGCSEYIFVHGNPGNYSTTSYSQYLGVSETESVSDAVADECEAAIEAFALAAGIPFGINCTSANCNNANSDSAIAPIDPIQSN